VRPGPEADLDAYVRETARGFFHPVATCAIGSVVDENGCVLGFENLYVADASIIPVIPRANTNLTVAALAEKLSEHI
jgi:choline dehydrogenase-like flavoprotein